MQNLNVKVTIFTDLSIWKNAYINKNINTIWFESIWWEPNSSADLKKELIVFVLPFVAEIYGF